MISVAVPNWSMVFVRHPLEGMSVFMRGPETAATTVPIPQDCDFFGVEFELGAFLPAMSPARLADQGVALPVQQDKRFVLLGETFEIPSFETADIFVSRLARAGHLVNDTTIAQTLLRQPIALTERSVQRRFVAATGLAFGTIRQMDRAARTAELLELGMSILDVVDHEGFSDQAHLTRSLKRFVGKTPGAIAPKTPVPRPPV